VLKEDNEEEEGRGK